MSKIKTQDHTAVASSTPQVAETIKSNTSSMAKPKSFQGLPFLFDKQNYILMAIGLVCIIIGYMLMSGGRSTDPNIFDADSLYSFRRITLAPFIVLIGLGIEGYAIMKKPSAK